MKKITKSDWQYMQKLGEINQGQFGQVWLMQDKRNAQLKYAVKRIPVPEQDSEEDQLKSEIVILEQIMSNHPSVIPQGIIHYYGYAKVSEQQIEGFDSISEYYYLFFEVVPGNLGKMMSINFKENKQTQPDILIKFFTDSLESLLFLQYQQICHRDLKPENILYLKTTIPSFKICDFGLSKKTRNSTFSQTYCGTIAYMAPELLKQKDQYNSYKSDVYSLGLCILALSKNQVPLNREEREQEEKFDPNDLIQGPNDQKIAQLMQNISTKYPNNDKIKGIIICLRHMLQYNPILRVDFIQLTKLAQQLQIVDFSQQISIWNKKELDQNQQNQTEQEKIYLDIIKQTEALEKENKLLEAQQWNSLTIEQKNKSMKEKNVYQEQQNKLYQLQNEYKKVSNEYEDILDDIQSAKDSIQATKYQVQYIEQQQKQSEKQYFLIYEEVEKKNGVLRNKSEIKQQWEDKLNSIKRKNQAQQQIMNNSEMQSIQSQVKTIAQQIEEELEERKKLIQYNNQLQNEILSQKTELEEIVDELKELKSKIDQKQPQTSSQSDGLSIFAAILAREQQRQRQRRMFELFSFI